MKSRPHVDGRVLALAGLLAAVMLAAAAVEGRLRLALLAAAALAAIALLAREFALNRSARAALKRSEERQTLAMQSSEEGFWDWTVPSDEFYASPRMLQMYGFAPGTVFASREAFIAQFPFHPEDRPKWEQAVAAHFAGETARFGIDIRALVHGELRWFHLTGMGARDAGGKVVRWTGSVRDITEQKHAEEALRTSEERYALAMEASGAGHWDWKIASDEFYGSPRWREIAGFTPGETLGARAEVLARFPFHPEDRPRYDAAMRAHLAGETPRVDIEVRVVPRGELRWLHVIGMYLRDDAGVPQRWAGSLTDITEQKHAKEALRLSEERYARAMEGSDAGHWDWNMATDEMFVSGRAKEMLGLGRGPLPATRKEIMALVPMHEEDRRSMDEKVAASLATGVDERDYRVISPCGEVRWLRSRAKVYMDAKGKPERMTGSLTDVTERKLAADARARSEERFALAAAGSQDGIWDWDLLTDEQYFSERAQCILGIEPGRTVRPKDEWDALREYHPEDRPHRLLAIERHLAGETPAYEGEWRVRPTGGEYHWVRSRGMCVRDAAGRPTRMVGSISDIDAAKRTADELRESEARFRSLTELSSDWYWRQDENLRFTYLSSEVSELAGFPAESSIGKARWELPSLTPLSSSWEEHRAQLETRKPFRDFEYSRTGTDGKLRYVSVSGAPMFDEQGRFRGYQGIGRNITERKRIEEELRQSEARFRSLTELSSDWYWQQDENLRFVNYLPEEVGTRSGVSARSSLGRTRWEFENVTPLSGTWEEHRAVLAARQPFRDFEYVRLDENGTPHYTVISGVPTFDQQGRFTGYQGVGRNISERRRFEAELRSRQEMLDLAQKSARAIAFEWRIGQGEGENRWSPDLEAMYGLAPGTYDGTYETWKKLVHPEDWPAVKEAIGHAHRTGDVTAEYRVVHPDGSIHWLQARGRMFFDGAGKPARMVGFMQDVTERRQAQEELLRLERRLRQAQRMEAMGTLAGGIAHDFNNILGAVLGYGEMALRNAPTGSRQRRDLDAIMAAGERGRALVDRVLAFSRSGVGERVAVNVEAVVREALDLFSANLPVDVTLHAKLHAGRAAMQGDPTQVHQVVMNLASNAVQAMPAGGTLRVSLDAARVDAQRIATTGPVPAGEYVVLAVADNGTGIAPDIIERIFDPFFTTKEVGTGTGLGLSLVHGIVTEVGGAVDVASTPGKGSTFTVYLPRSGDAEESQEAVEAALPRGDGQRVLVIDDEESLVRLATETLAELGYEPLGYTSSTAALEAFRADPLRFDAVITDERMPGMTGSALIREVRGLRGGIPVVLMSGFVGGGVLGRAREAGADDVLKKPLSARELASSLARVLQP